MKTHTHSDHDHSHHEQYHDHRGVFTERVFEYRSVEKKKLFI